MKYGTSMLASAAIFASMAGLEPTGLSSLRLPRAKLGERKMNAKNKAKKKAQKLARRKNR